MTIEELENSRLLLQAQLDSQKSLDDRKMLGQFATPTNLGRNIVSYGLSLLPENDNIRFLDPAIGTGCFYSALIATTKNREIKYARGFEIDPLYCIPSQKFWSGYSLEIELGDFILMEPNEKYNFLICNPPYVRHQYIKEPMKRYLSQKCNALSGHKLSGLAGLYCYFILFSLQWMEKDAIAGWLIPSEFMDVNYGRELKNVLLNDVTLLRIHRFDPNDIQFDDALVSSAVIWIKNTKPTGNYSVSFTYGGNLDDFEVSSEIDAKTLKREDKWTRFPQKEARNFLGNHSVLSDYFKIQRGIATGNNSFFIMEKEKIDKLNLPMELFKPILPSSKYLTSDQIDTDENGNPIISPRKYLLDCKLSEEKIQENYPSLWEYLKEGKDKVSTGYLCSNRKKWYFQEQREPPLFFCTYMGRSDKKKPFRFFLNHSKAIASNNFLHLYPNEQLRLIISEKPEVAKQVWKMLDNITSESIISEGRVYGGGLHKVEPKELGKVSAYQLEEFLQKENLNDS